MTTLRRWGLRTPDPGGVLLIVGLLAWSTATVAVHLGYVVAPGGSRTDKALTYAVPLGLVAVAVLRRGRSTPLLPLVAGLACVVTFAVVLPARINGDPKIALAVPAVALGAYLTNRFPTTTMSLIFLLTGTYGSIKAFTNIPADSVADKVIDGLWAGVLGRLVIGRRALTVRPTPALLLLGAYLGATLIAVFTGASLQNSIRAFRLAPLFLSLVIVIGYGGFSRRTLELLARVMVVVSLLVAAYAALRWAIGTSGQEKALAKTEFQRQYNHIAVSNDLKVQGSLPNGGLLGLWLTCTTPFLVAIAVSWRGRFRILAGAALPFAVIGLLGSAQRAAAVAVIAGTLTVIGLHVLSRGFRGPRLGVAVATVLVLLVSAVVVYPVVLDNPTKRARYTNLLTPSQDLPIQTRLKKWRGTLDSLRGHPFGYGLGAGNPTVVGHRFADIGRQEIDNSFLMIAYDQGMAIMVLFAIALLVLLAELLRYAVWTRGPGPSAFAGAAAGTLVAMIIEFVATDFVTNPPVVAGWMIVGLGVSQFAAGIRRPAAQLV